jgi:hypothetical protein
MQFFIKFNSALGRDVSERTGVTFKRPPYTDTVAITLPSFLSNVVRNVFGRKLRDGDENKLAKEDIVISSCVAHSSLISTIGAYYKEIEVYFDSFNKISDDYLKFIEASISSNSASLNKTIQVYGKEVSVKDLVKEFLHSLNAANLKEIKKRQLLVGSPLRHHNLSFGDHFVHAKTPSGFETRNWEWVDQAAIAFKRFTNLKRATHYTLPIGTSQGFTLKTESDGPVWRTVSKGLLSSLAKKTKSYADFQRACAEIDSLFTERGFSEVSKSYFLGLRRQHSVKEEVIDDVGLSHPGFSYDLDTSSGLQGRARGIFPPSEYAKAYFKPFSEGLKKNLFHKSDVCNVNQSFIDAKLRHITNMSLVHGLLDGEYGSSKGWYPFYDLSAYDTSTHSGCSDIYHRFLNIAFDDFANIEGEHFRDFNVIFPVGLTSKPIIAKQFIKGRSTQSGQSDVTVKNNIVHLLLASQAISEALSDSKNPSLSKLSLTPVDIFTQLITGNGRHPYLCALMHGDDSAIFFSTDKEDYVKFYKYMTEFGISTGTEITGVYLKKTTSIDDVITDLSNYRYSLIAQTPGHVVKCRSIINQERDYTGCVAAFDVLNEDYKNRNQRKKSLKRMDLPVVRKIFPTVDKDVIGFRDDVRNICNLLIKKISEPEYSKSAHSLALKKSIVNYLVMFENLPIDSLISSVSGISSDRNLSSMKGLPGSLARNRFGEYGVKHFLLHIMALSDTYLMLPENTPIAAVMLWDVLLLAGLLGAFDTDPIFSNQIKIGETDKLAEARQKLKKNLSTYNGSGDKNLGQELLSREKILLEVITLTTRMFEQATKGKTLLSQTIITSDFRASLLAVITKFTESSQLKAANLRGILDRLFYSNGEQFDSEELLDMYGAIQYDPEDLSSRLGVSNMKFDELLNIILKYQKDILDSQIAPTVFDDISVNDINHILKRM